MAEVLPTLKRGSRGDAVKSLQTALGMRGFNIGPAGVDGDFGPSTEKAVRAFQSANGLTVDGIAGEQTLGALGLKWAGKSVPTPSDSEIYSPSTLDTGSSSNMTTYLVWGGVAVVAFLIAKKKGWIGKKGRR